MCSIDRRGNCTNWYCSCLGRVYGVHLKKSWVIYEIEARPWWNRIIGWFINLKRKPSVYPPSLSVDECKHRKCKTDEIRRRYSLLEDKEV
jgi:hypothetical protein